MYAYAGGGYLSLCVAIFPNKMVWDRQHAVCHWQRLGRDKKTWPIQWWQSGRHFEVMTSKLFRFVKAFIY